MAIIEDYAGIAAELRGIRAAEQPAPDPKPQVGAYIAARGAIQIGIGPAPAARVMWRNSILPRRGWSTD